MLSHYRRCSANWECSYTSPKICISAEIVWLHYHDLWWLLSKSLSVSSSYSLNQSAIHWKLSWVGAWGRRCDPQMSSCWWSSILERCRKLCLVLKQWVAWEILLIFLLHNTTAEICFIFISFLPDFFPHSFCISTRLLVWKFMTLTDKKVINNEHFVQRSNELTINNAMKHLSGNYSCIVEFLNSGAKLRTPYELINIVGEYHNPLQCLLSTQDVFPLKLLHAKANERISKNPKLKLRKISLTQPQRPCACSLWSYSQRVDCAQNGCLAQHKVAVELHSFHGSTAKRKST